MADVRLTFTDAYRRSQAAGIRGNYASFGLFGDLGKPIALDLHDDEPVYLLIEFRWFTGINQARRWAPVLRTWSSTHQPMGGVKPTLNTPSRLMSSHGCAA